MVNNQGPASARFLWIFGVIAAVGGASELGAVTADVLTGLGFGLIETLIFEPIALVPLVGGFIGGMFALSAARHAFASRLFAATRHLGISLLVSDVLSVVVHATLTGTLTLPGEWIFIPGFMATASRSLSVFLYAVTDVFGYAQLAVFIAGVIFLRRFRRRAAA